MNRTCFCLIALVALVAAGCEKGTAPNEASAAVDTSFAPTVTSVHGAWLGEGEFTATEGKQQIKAQLELLSDNSYRFMVIEPRVLMMVVGLEKGNWQLTDQTLNLTPLPDQTSDGPGTGKLGALNSAPKNFRPKTLTVDGDAFILKDAQMDLRFNPNPGASAKLHQRGDI